MIERQEVISISDSSVSEEISPIESTPPKKENRLLNLCENITNKDNMGRELEFISNLSKTYFVSALAVRLGRPVIKKNEKMDLFSLVRKYKKEAMEIALEDEYDVKPSESKGVQVQSQLCKRVRNMFTQGKSVKEITTLILQQIGSDFEGLDDNEMYREVEGNPFLFALFHAEKDLLLEECFILKEHEEHRVYSNKPKVCQDCGDGEFEYDAKMEQYLCSVPCERNQPRKNGDFIFQPNLTFDMQFTGLNLQKEKKERTWWANHNKMPLLPSRGQNNILEVVRNCGYEHTSLTGWSGSLVNKIINAPNISYVQAENAKAIHHAIKKEHRAQLEIRFISKAKGYGVFATTDIEKNTVVSTYTGEMCLSREHKFWVHNNSMVRVGWVGNDELFIAPESFANVGRFFNEPNKKIGEKPNMRAQWVLVDGVRVKGETRPTSLFLILATERKVKKGEELIWNYGNEYGQAYEATYEDQVQKEKVGGKMDQGEK